MNQEQLFGIIKPIAAAIVAYLAASHVLFDYQTWNIVITSVVAIALAIWSYYQNTNHNQVARVDDMAKDPNSPVKAIIMDNTQAGADMANSMPGMTSSVAGSSTARSASESGSPAVQP